MNNEKQLRKFVRGMLCEFMGQTVGAVDGGDPSQRHQKKSLLMAKIF